MGEVREKMSIEEISKTAFAKWLLQQSTQEACDHLMECLSRPSDGREMVWDLLEHTGDNRYTSKTLTKAIELLRKNQR